MLGLKPAELLLILALVFLLFGGKKLPQLGASVGEAIRGFKRAVKEPDEFAAHPVDPEALKALDPAPPAAEKAVLPATQQAAKV